MREKLKKYDNAILGVIISAILPVIGFLIYYPIRSGDMDLTFSEYVSLAIREENRNNTLITCMIPNMLLFYFTNFRWQLNEFTKGLVAVTLLLAVVMIIYSLV